MNGNDYTADQTGMVPLITRKNLAKIATDKSCLNLATHYVNWPTSQMLTYSIQTAQIVTDRPRELYFFTSPFRPPYGMYVVRESISMRSVWVQKINVGCQSKERELRIYKFRLRAVPHFSQGSSGERARSAWKSPPASHYKFQINSADVYMILTDSRWAWHNRRLATSRYSVTPSVSRPPRC